MLFLPLMFALGAIVLSESRICAGDADFSDFTVKFKIREHFLKTVRDALFPLRVHVLGITCY